MDFEQILTMIRTVSECGLTEFEIEEKEMRIRMKKKAEVLVSTVDVSGNTVNTSENTVEKSKSDEGKGGKLITSPLVGTFYAAPHEGAGPYIKEGDTVKKGQVMGIVEAMKLMNEIESEFDGVVDEVLVANGQTVEYGQPLFRIR